MTITTYEDTIEDRQRYFDKTAKHLLGATKRAMAHIDGDDVCLYRTADGGACAIGCHIPDDHPAASVDSPYKGSWTCLIGDFPELNGLAVPHFDGGGNWSTLAGCLQQCHDDAGNWYHGGGLGRSGIESLRWIANEFGINADVLEGEERP